jgi:hypothetical protein
LPRGLAAPVPFLTMPQCDEVHPVCSSCNRHAVECIYRDQAVKPAVDHASRAASNNTAENGTPGPDNGSSEHPDHPDHPESEARRLLELRLFHQWVTKSAFSFPGSHDKSYREAVITTTPINALQHPAWLYTLFAFSAIHIAKTSPSPSEAQEFMVTHRRYLDLGLQEHRRDIAGLCLATADAICMTSSMVRNCMHAQVQDRSLHPYSPPAQWLHMTKGSGDVFKTAWDWVRDDETSIARKVATIGPDLSNLDELFGESKRAPFAHLLQRSPADAEREAWDAEIERAYELPLRYIGGVQIAVNEGEEAGLIFRRVMAFPMFVPKRYIELVEEGQPRALVILAYYFAFLARLRGVWWIGDTGRREIRAIRSLLGSEWEAVLDWPLRAMEELSEFIAFEYP